MNKKHREVLSYKDRKFMQRFEQQTRKYLRCLDCKEQEKVKDKWTNNELNRCKLNGKYCVEIDNCPKGEKEHE